MFFPNFSGSLLGKQIRKLTTTPKKPRASMSLSYVGHRPSLQGVVVGFYFLWRQAGRGIGSTRVPVHTGSGNGRGLRWWAWPPGVAWGSRAASSLNSFLPAPPQLIGVFQSYEILQPHPLPPRLPPRWAGFPGRPFGLTTCRLRLSAHGPALPGLPSCLCKFHA